MTNLEKSHKTALCSAVRTSRYSRKVVILLRDMAEELYKTDTGNPWQIMENSMEGELLEFFKNYLSDVDFNNPTEAEEALRAVIGYLSQLEELTFIVPIHPNREFVERLYGWCSENINDEILLDFTTNRLMESGLIMVYKGHYYSYTLADLLDEYFSNHDLKRYYVEQKKQEDPTQSVEQVQSQAQQVKQEAVQNGE